MKDTTRKDKVVMTQQEYNQRYDRLYFQFERDIRPHKQRLAELKRTLPREEYGRSVLVQDTLGVLSVIFRQYETDKMELYLELVPTNDLIPT